jgi:hypothetical protein
MNYSFKKIEVLVLMLLVILPGTLNAQLNLNGGLTFRIDDNIYNNYEQVNDEVFAAGFQMSTGIIPGFSKFKLYYDGTFNYYKRNIDRTFHEHTAGIEYSSSIGRKENTALNFGAEYSITGNRSSYSYLDNSSIYAYGTIRQYLSEGIFGKLEYGGSNNMFSEYNDFNNLQNHLSGSITGFISSETTLGVELKGGIKTYLNALNVLTGKNGINKKGNSGKKGSNIIRIDASGNFRQELFSKTDLQIVAGLNKILINNVRYITSGNISSMGNIFDDEFSYEGFYTSVTLSQQLPWNMFLFIGAVYNNMNFINRPAYDLNGNVISGERIDNTASISIDITKNFKIFELKLMYQYANNISNDLYYNSRNNIFSFQISSGF